MTGLEAFFGVRARLLQRLLVVDPARVYRRHEDAGLAVILGAGASHHVERLGASPQDPLHSLGAFLTFISR